MAAWPASCIPYRSSGPEENGRVVRSRSPSHPSSLVTSSSCVLVCLCLCLLRLFALRKRLRRTKRATAAAAVYILRCTHNIHTCRHGMHAWKSTLSYHSYDGISYSYTSTNHYEVPKKYLVDHGSSEFLVPLNKERTPNKTKTQNNCTYGCIHVFCVSRIQASPHI